MIQKKPPKFLKSQVRENSDVWKVQHYLKQTNKNGDSSVTFIRQINIPTGLLLQKCNFVFFPLYYVNSLDLN